MPQVKFDEFEAYAASIRDANLHCTLPRLQQPSWAMWECGTSPLHIQAGFEGSGNIAEGVIRRDGFVIFVHRGGTPPRANGVVLNEGSAVVMSPGAEFCFAYQGAHDWASVFVPLSLLNVEDCFHSRLFGVRYANNAEAKSLALLFDSLFRQRRTAGDFLARGAERKEFVRDVSITCQQILGVSSQKAGLIGRPSRSREDLIAETVSLITESLEVHLTVAELAEANNCSERTLRNAFQEYFGMPPSKYAELLRLRRARSLLKDSDSTVTEIAGSLGYWDFGRFAGRYRKVFGELPSQTRQLTRQMSFS